MSVFEWGAGGSTLFLAERVRSVVSVEHDREWIANVVRKIHETGGINNVSLFTCEPEEITTRVPNYGSSDSRYSEKTFFNYVSKIDDYPDEDFDVVIVDGRARNHRIRHAIRKVRVGGYLILDNSEREEYRPGWETIKHWPCSIIGGPGPYNEYPWETRIWHRCP